MNDCRRRLLTTAGLLPLLLLTLLPASAQEATPGAMGTPGAACDVAPRSADELLALAATPAAEPGADATPAGMPDGEPAADETVAAIQETLRLAIACAEEGDLPGLLALYSDRYVAQQILAREPVPIVPGRPDESPTTHAGTPPATIAQPVVEEARLLSDGRVVARVVTGERAEQVVVVRNEEDDRWVIDEVESITTEATPAPSPAAGQPPEAQAALAAAAEHLGIDQGELTVGQIEPREWSDSSLGCPQEGEFYAQVITPGYLVIIQGDGRELEYHTDEGDEVVLCEER